MQSLSDGYAVVNNGTIDLDAEQGLLHMHKQLIFIHEDMDLYPAVGANAAAAVKVSNSVVCFEFRIGDEMFTQGRLDDIVGDMVNFEAHFSVDNAVADRWIAFEINLITTNGGGDKVMTTPDIAATAGPFLVPTTPHQMFRINGQLPATFFGAGEKYVYFGIKRIDATTPWKSRPR